MKVVIVGGGIVGLAAAWAMARAGHAVELCEQGPLPNPLGSSQDNTRLIRYTYGSKRNYARMVGPAYRALASMARDLGADFHVPTGTLLLARNDDPSLRACVTDLDDLGIPYETLEAAALPDRFPLLREASDACALWTPTGGVLLARRLLDALVGWLEANSRVALLPGTRVVAIDRAHARIETAAGEAIAGDRLIVAAGPWAPTLLPELEGRVTPSRQVVMELEVPPTAARAWSTMPMVLDGIAADGSGFYAVPPVTGTALKIGDHSFSRKGDPDADRSPKPHEYDHVLELARARLAAVDTYRPVRAWTCFYSLAPEERFIAEAQGPTLALAGLSGHGFKFGPLIGLAAQAWSKDRIDAASLAEWLAGRLPETPLSLALDEA